MVMGIALKAVADIYNIKISEASQYLRKNPLLGHEIHIDEELANLEEAVFNYWSAEKSFKQKYPKLHQHLASERSAALNHSIGLIMRMIKGQKLPFPYTQADATFALRKLTGVAMYEVQAAGHTLDEKTLRKIRPLMNWRQRLALKSDGTERRTFNSVSLRRLTPSRLKFGRR